MLRMKMGLGYMVKHKLLSQQKEVKKKMNELLFGIGIGWLTGWTLAVTFIKYTQKKILGNRWKEFNDLLNKNL